MTNVYAWRRSRAPLRQRWVRLAPALGLLLGACDFPTALPKWNTQWLVPSRSTTISVGELLPSNVAVTADGSAFLATLPAVTMTRTLGELCGSACTLAAGRTLPKPAFSATVSDTLRMPADVSGATLAAGTLALSISNGFGFDPLRPGPNARGAITVSVTSGARTVGRLTISGDSTALPAGATLSRTLALSGGAVGGKLAIAIGIISPAGDSVTIDPQQRFTVTAAPQTIRLSDVTVSVPQKQVALNTVVMSLADIDQTLVDRVKGGAVVLTVTNPFAVSGTLTLDFLNAAMPISKQVALQPGTTSPRIPFTQEEMKAMLRHDITLTATGTVTGSGPMTITPAQVVRINTQVELTLGPKEG